MVWVKRPWFDLFEPGYEEIQDNKTRNLSDDLFIEQITNSMKVVGYNLKAARL